tara:strand:+ start:655 stop:1092 length:438 start_codon:yes stop_codon:yes gene_type:complete
MINKSISLFIASSLLFFGCQEKVIHGCLDSKASNYNSSANVANNSCEYHYPDLKSDITIKVKFKNVYGLEKGNEIIFSGLVIGQVQKVGSLNEGLAPIVTLNIKEMYSDILYEDTQFSIKSPLLVVSFQNQKDFVLKRIDFMSLC